MAGLVRNVAMGLFALAATLCGCQAQDRMQATLDKPAVVTANLTGPLMTDTPGPLRVRLSIVAFTPPPDRKPVEIVVSASAAPNGVARELGRVAITPYVAFGHGDKAHWQNFAFAVPADLAHQITLKVSVALVPVIGGGKGASLEVGDASIR